MEPNARTAASHCVGKAGVPIYIFIDMFASVAVESKERPVASHKLHLHKVESWGGCWMPGSSPEPGMAVSHSCLLEKYPCLRGRGGEG